MKVFLITLIFAIVVGVGCTERSAPTIPQLPIIPSTGSSDSSTTQRPIFISPEPAIEPSLYIQNAQIRDITTTTAILEYDTTIPSIGVIILIAAEKEYSRYYISNKSTKHYQALTFLRPSTFYTVVIESTGSKADRTVITFTTLTPIEIISTPSYSYPYFFPLPSGYINAIWYDGDGSFNSGIWSVDVYPAETKQCRIKIGNYLGYSITAKLTALLTEYPIGGEGKVVINSDDLVVANGTEAYFTIRVVVSGDAPIGLYEFNIGLEY